MSTEPPDPTSKRSRDVAQLHRWMQCQELIANAADEAGFSGADLNAACLLYWIAGAVYMKSTPEQVASVALGAFDFVRGNPTVSVVTLDDLRERQKGQSGN